ncbi:hypothetical protein Cpir12675_003329 [Ceratocystis pirilliformis]|uniref:Nucleolar 27S pre-rRNA processing Urb2/Npa2 C-terminal domain-containing protein n=1 Tax=Ceratocystis pirilliformis TaxID=259994 RepID=A0ABR3Z513_9PEZI
MKPENNLAKLARSLEKTGPGAQGETLDELWRLLTTSIDSEHYAIEETVLRWLLKLMSGPATKTQAETVRRYPLTWTIIEHVFNRIPFFSLAKCLADRKFISILQLSLNNLSGAVSLPMALEGGKRKRSQNVFFDLKSLKSTECSLECAEALLAAIATLLARLDSQGLSSRDIMGAEHIKSLFASSANEALGLVTPILSLCSTAMSTSSLELRTKQKVWPSVMCSMWDLHRIGSTDAIEVASTTSLQVLQMISALDHRKYGTSKNQELPVEIQAVWKQKLENFYIRAVIFPARAAFLNSEDTEILGAIMGAIESKPLVCAPVLYTLSLDAPELNVGSLKSRENWHHQMFSSVQSILDPVCSYDKSLAMTLILDIARAREAAIQRESLHKVCKDYVLGSDSTQWSVLLRVLVCDRHVIFYPHGEELLSEELCRRASHVGSGDTCSGDEVQQVVRQMKLAYAEARDLSTFWKLWYNQLCFCESKNTIQSSPWLDETLRYDSTTSSNIESHMTPAQLSHLLQWLSEQSYAKAGPRYVLLDSIASQIRSPDFTDPTAVPIMNLALDSLKQVPSHGSLSTLRWCILAKIVHWLSPKERNKIWAEVEHELTQVAVKGSLENADAFEAFKFLDQLWLSMYPDGEYEPEVSAMALKIAKHLAKGGSKKAGVSNSNSESSFPSEYLDVATRVSSRLIPLLSAKSNTFPKFIRKHIINCESPDSTTFGYFSALISNENIVNNRKLVESLIDALINILSSNALASHKYSAISILASIPDDCFSRTSRESIMTSSMSFLTKPTIHESALWKISLGLMSKMMKRSTFYENISFDHLVLLSDSASACFSREQHARKLPEIYGLDVLFEELVSAIIKQMVSQFEEWGRPFLKTAEKFVAECPSDIEYLETRLLRIVLLKALIITVKKIGLKDPTAFDLDKAEKLLLSMVKKTILEYQSKSQAAVSSPYVILAAIDASEVVRDAASQIPKLKAKKLEPLATKGITQGTFLGWKTRIFLIHTLRDSVKSLPSQFQQGLAPEEGAPPDVLRFADYEALIRETLYAVTGPMDGNTLLAYFHSLIDALDMTKSTELQLKAIKICASIISSKQGADAGGAISISTAYNKLIIFATNAPNGHVFIKTCDILRLFLNSSSARLKQWNIEQTLAMVSDISGNPTSSMAVKDSPVVFDWLCKLMESVLRRFRVRLDGRFHLLIAALQSLLSGLLLAPYDAQLGKWTFQPANVRDGDFPYWGRHAASLTRLLTMVCEPMAASVAHHKKSPSNTLDTATDIAKRAAGRHMYLILVSYVKLQLQVDVPRPVRDALELGMNTIFNITPPEVRKILNDSLDMSGRAILGTQYKRYKQFGKWTGV